MWHKVYITRKTDIFVGLILFLSYIQSFSSLTTNLKELLRLLFTLLLFRLLFTLLLKKAFHNLLEEICSKSFYNLIEGIYDIMFNKYK
jgi:hypothetical protein